MSATGAALGLEISVLTLGIGTLVYVFIAALLDGLRNGEWGLFIVMIVTLGVPALGALIGAVIA